MLKRKTCFNILRDGLCYLLGALLSVKIILLVMITLFYYWRSQPFDWVFVVLVGMLVAFREAKELLAIWKSIPNESTE